MIDNMIPHLGYRWYFVMIIHFSFPHPELNPCNPNPCVNGGTCRAVPGDDEYKCTCLPEYTGENCEDGKVY